MILRIAQRTRQRRVMDVEIYVIEFIIGLSSRTGYELANQLRDELDRLGISAASVSI